MPGALCSPVAIDRVARELGVTDVDDAVVRDAFEAFDSFWGSSGYVRLRATDRPGSSLSFTFLGRPLQELPEDLAHLSRGVRERDADGCARLDTFARKLLRNVYGAMWLGADFEVDLGLVKHYFAFCYGLDVATLERYSDAPASLKENSETVRGALSSGIQLMALNYRAGGISVYGLVNDVAPLGEVARAAFPDVPASDVERFQAEAAALRHDAPRNLAFTFGLAPDRLARCGAYVSYVVERSGLDPERDAAAHPELERLFMLLRAARESFPGVQLDTVLGWSFGGRRGPYRKFEVSFGNTAVRVGGAPR